MNNLPKIFLKWIAVIGLILIIPFLAMHMTGQVNWTAFDFIVIGTLLAFLAIGWETINYFVKNRRSRAIMLIGLLCLFILIWMQLAVNIIDNIPLRIEEYLAERN